MSNSTHNNNKPKTIENKLDDQDSILADALRTLNETEQVADASLNKLYENKEKILNAKGKSSEITGNNDVARRSLNNIKNRSGFMGFINALNPFKK